MTIEVVANTRVWEDVEHWSAPAAAMATIDQSDCMIWKRSRLFSFNVRRTPI